MRTEQNRQKNIRCRGEVMNAAVTSCFPSAVGVAWCRQLDHADRSNSSEIRRPPRGSDECTFIHSCCRDVFVLHWALRGGQQRIGASILERGSSNLPGLPVTASTSKPGTHFVGVTLMSMHTYHCCHKALPRQGPSRPVYPEAIARLATNYTATTWSKRYEVPWADRLTTR